MARAIQWPWTPEVISQATKWRERCFFGEKSIFSNNALWTLENVEIVLERIRDLKKGSGNYYEKLRIDLDGAPDAAIRFDAELHWFMYLFLLGRSVPGYPTNAKPETKRSNFKIILSWASTNLPSHHAALQDEALSGLGSNGRFLVRLYDHHRYMLQTLSAWKRLSLKEQEVYRPLNSAWDFAAWCDDPETNPDTNPEMRNALLYFLYHDRFESIMSSRDKKKIVRGLNGFMSRQATERFVNSGSFESLLSVDQAIFEIRRNLEREVFDNSFDFYLAFLDDNATHKHKMEVISEEEALSKMHNKIGAVGPSIVDTLPLSLEELEEIEAERRTEGEKRLITHYRGERNPALRRCKIQQMLKKHGVLQCECCGTKAKAYARERRHRVFEVHHKKPLSDGLTINGVDDLSLLCANCHKAIHASDPLKSVDKFRSECQFSAG